MDVKNVAVVAGTRPECIKMAPVYFELKTSSSIHPVFLCTGQHREMLDQALTVFGIQPDCDLGLMQPRQELASLTSSAIDAIARWIASERPAALLVQGDTTTALCAALAAFYAHVPVGHVEAGLRTGDMAEPFPEELNRVLVTRLTAIHF